MNEQVACATKSVLTQRAACTRSLEEHQGCRGGSLRVFKQFAWLGVGLVKAMLSRPAQQPLAGFVAFQHIGALRIVI